MASNEPQPPGGWLVLPAPRLAPPAGRGPLFSPLSRLAKRYGRDRVPDVFRLLHHNASLFWGWLHFASQLMPFGSLSARQRELAILRTAWLCRCRYEWGQHVEVAGQAGVGDAEILDVTRGADAFAAPADRALLLACDELVHDHGLSDAAWQALAAHFDPKRLIEIMLLIGHYRMLAGLLNSAGLALEAPMEARLQAFYERSREA